MLTVIVWIILIYFALWLLWRLLVPWLLKRFFRKMERSFSAQGQKARQKKKHGEVSIEEPAHSGSKRDHRIDESEYVDFEEIVNDKSKPQ